MEIRPGCAQHIGSRTEQQDSFAFSHIEDTALVRRAGILAVVADGMGGMAMGRESAAAAVSSFLGVHEASAADASPMDVLHQALQIANEEVLSHARSANVEGEAGSTLVVVIVKGANLYWASVGDSRIYLYRSNELVQLNTEQNYATNLMYSVVAGELSRDEALKHPERAGLTNFIGNPDIKPPDANHRPFPIQKGDWLILCSDGLFGTLDDNDIREELYGNPNDASERLIKKTIARNKPNQDNVTVAILACGDREPITVRRKKSPLPHEEIFTPVKSKALYLKRFVLIVASLLVLCGLALFYGRGIYQKITAATAKKNAIQKPHSSAGKPLMVNPPGGKKNARTAI